MKMNNKRELIIKVRGWTPSVYGEASPNAKEENLL